MRRVLITGPGFTQTHIARLEAVGYELLHRPVIESDELRELLPTITAYILGGDERLEADDLRRAERLELISFVGTGFEAFVDQHEAVACGITIRNTPDTATAAVVEHTMGMILGVVRQLFDQNERAKRGGAMLNETIELSRVPVGIVGMGRIGERVARVLRQGFGCPVVYANRTRKRAVENELGLTYVPLNELVRRSQLLVLLVAYSSEMAHLVNSDMLTAARDGLMLVNTASAHLVDPVALRTALASGKVKSAAFDGYWIEPLPTPADDPFGLLNLPDAKFVVTPHTAAKTAGTWSRMTDAAVENVLAHAGGKRS
jgi:glyoxylate reductase